MQVYVHINIYTCSAPAARGSIEGLFSAVGISDFPSTTGTPFGGPWNKDSNVSGVYI